MQVEQEMLKFYQGAQRSVNRLVRSPYLCYHQSSVMKMDHLQRTESNSRESDIIPASVTQIQSLSKTVKKLTLTLPDAVANFKPGQWVDLFIPDISTVGGFSMCSSPLTLQKNNTLDLAIKESKHPPAFWVHNHCHIGAKVGIRFGGDFYLKDNDINKPLLFLAGGVGINPLLSMLLHVADKRNHNSSHTPVVLLYSAKTLEDMIFLEEIQGAMRRCSKGVFLQFITGESEKLKGNRIYSHRIDQKLIARCIDDHFGAQSNDVLSFLCGPSPFIDSMESFLMAAGLKKSSIIYEKWW